MKVTKTFFILYLLISCLSITSYGQLTAKMTNKGIGYLEHLPPDYAANPTKTYPLIIFLHGAGEKGSGSPSDLEKIKNLGPPKHIKNGHNMCFDVGGETECFIVIAPQLPGGKPSWGVSLIDGVFNYAFNGPDNYRIDMSRVYLTGLSLGGNGVYKYAYMSVNEPNKLAALTPVAAWADNNQGCVISERKIPVWAFHGDQDNTVGYPSGLAMFNSIADCTDPTPTSELLFTTYEGVGHNSWSRAYRTDNSLHSPNLYEWFLTKTLSGNPTANAGADKEITLPTNSITLSGSGSDTDGSITTYSWSKLSGPSATLTNANSATLSLSNLLEGTYVFELTVTDNDGISASDQAIVTVNPQATNQAPTVNAGNDIEIQLPTSSTNINGTASDSDGSIVSRQWVQQNGPTSATLSGATTNTLSASNLSAGTYVFRFTATDDDGASAFDEVNVNVLETNQSPTADAGSDKNVQLPTNTVVINGSGSDNDGSINSYLWEKTSGPGSITLTNQTTSNVTASNLVEGIYNLQLTVTDNDGASDSDNVTVTVVAANQNPTANAGSDINLTLPTNSTNISGSGSDPDGSITSYSWTQTSGAAATLTNASNAQVNVSNLSTGTSTFQLLVTDNEGATDTDLVNVIVNAAPVNLPPVANAGSDKNIALPTNSVVLNGSGVDSDGTISSHSWTKISGPATFTLSGENTSVLTASNLVSGTYEFRLTVTDDDGASDTDVALVNVAPETVNQAPDVNAGSDKAITLPTDQVSFSGSATDSDGTITSYSWSQINGPSSATLSGESTQNLTASGLIAGQYDFQLEATDNDGTTGSDNVSVSVSSANISPDVFAGNDINLILPTNSVDISGTASDADGSIISTNWTQTQGVAASFTVSGSTISITDLIEGYYAFEFSATDNQGAQNNDEVQVVVTTGNSIPVVNAGIDQTITLPTNSINLSGSATDSDGTIISYSWTKESGPSATLVNASTSTLTANNLVEGSYVFKLTATDDDGDIGSDEVSVLVNPESTNTPPTANAGNNKNITLPTNTVTINGSGSDPDGTVTTYAWTKVSGSSVTINNENTASVTLSNLLEGTYIFRLTVTDNDGAQDTDDVTITVSPSTVNQEPVANAGNDINLILPTNSTNLTGSGSDSDGSIVSYSWMQVSGPSTATLNNANNATATINNLAQGTYIFKLTVTDDDDAQDEDEVSIVVYPEGANQSPFADAGADSYLVLPTNSTNINGSGSDPDGTVTSYVWSKLSGPTAELSNISSPTLTISEMVEGIYVLELTVTDNDGASGSDEVTIQVLPESTNQSPSVDVGSDINLILPENNTVINGSASDNDGTIASTVWTQLNGPSTATLSNSNTLDLTIEDLIEGTYSFRLTATDDDGAEGSDQINVSVLPENTNAPPVASAGSNQSIYLPINTTQVEGSATDSDGTVDSYQWEKISGPSLTIVSPQSSTSEISDLIEGNYLLRLTVTDNDGASHFDEISIKVFSEGSNQNPIANAGEDVFVELPDNSTVLTGTGSDPDGSISTYFWEVLSGPNNPTLTGQYSATLTVGGLIAGPYQLQLVVEDAGGLSNSDRVNIFVISEEVNNMQTPVVNAGEDQTVELPVTNIRLIGRVVEGGFIESFNWEQLSGNALNLIGADNDTLIINDPTSGVYELQFTATDNEGLSGTDIVSITVSGESISNTGASPSKMFSPNGDGIGDMWVLTDDLSTISECELKIYDKRGMEIYSAAPYQNDWNGTFNGNELPEGVYFFVLKCPNGSDTKSGSITLIK
ncbi:MAG: PKD domain-containing protein [Fulvivirga sp.]